MAKQPTITLTFTLDQYDAIRRAVIKSEELHCDANMNREDHIVLVCEDWARPDS